MHDLPLKHCLKVHFWRIKTVLSLKFSGSPVRTRSLRSDRSSSFASSSIVGDLFALLCPLLRNCIPLAGGSTIFRVIFIRIARQACWRLFLWKIYRRTRWPCSSPTTISCFGLSFARRVGVGLPVRSVSHGRTFSLDLRSLGGWFMCWRLVVRDGNCFEGS